MVLSDRSIKEELAAGRIKIDPLNTKNIQPASVDVTLGDKILVSRSSLYPSHIDIKKDLQDMYQTVTLGNDSPFFLQSREFVLATTLESITLPNDLVARLEGKSSLWRLGLLTNSTAGYVDPGWQGNLTVQLYNISNVSITLYAGMKIGQVSFLRLTSPADRPYGSPGLKSKYQGQVDPTASRFYKDFQE